MILAMGGLWMVAALAFIAARAGIAVDSWWGVPLAGAAAFVSLVVTVVWWNDARIGAILSAAILFRVVAPSYSSGGTIRYPYPGLRPAVHIEETTP